MEEFKVITIETTVNAPVEKVWEYYNDPKHVTSWNTATPDWHSPRAENDLRPGGKFNYRMEAKDGSFGFDFAGEYDEVKKNELLRYHMGDNRKVRVEFIPSGNGVRVVTHFDAEKMNSEELQRNGWQSILDNFKKYVESNN